MLASRWLVLWVYPFAVGATECLVGCLVQGISPFDDENLAVWDDRTSCDSTTLGCEVSAINYPTTYYQGALWASTSGTDGSSDCTCDICDPYPYSDTTSYMEDETSLWSRIHCYLAASEASGYDVSPCVAAIVDTGILPCVDDVYEEPTLGLFDCEENLMRDISSDASIEECTWDGELREAQELFLNAVISNSTSSSSAASTSPLASDTYMSSSSESEWGAACGVGNVCSDDLCCHPDTSTCGREYTYCQERDFSDGPRCCSGVDGDSSSSNVCLEDSICDESDSLSQAVYAGISTAITIVILICICICIVAVCCNEEERVRTVMVTRTTVETYH